MFARNVNGLLSALLSLKLQPSVIRYAGASRVAKAVAAECASQIAADGIFHFASGKRGEHRGRKRVCATSRARFPLVPADLWTSDRPSLSKHGAFLWNDRARNTHVEATLNHPFPRRRGAAAARARPRGRRGDAPAVRLRRGFLFTLSVAFLTASSRGEFEILASSLRSPRRVCDPRGELAILPPPERRATCAPASPRLESVPASPRWTLRSRGGTRAASNRPASRKTPRAPAGRSGRTRPWSTSSWA